ncbi:cupin domain-containing protein [Dokdonella sp.]|uniref:AraC family transcriptional regulator n=1 Tax=Dokdonella sp. TaxID=2291710 RepID=UPI0031C4227D|nr:AraC family transcriptional regulator [Dokdonella sp.]
MATVDRLSAVLERFRLSAHLFHAGPLCGLVRFDARPGRGFLHVLRRGELVVTHPPRSGLPARVELREPALLFYPRPLAHAFHNAPVDGADFVCATLDFAGGAQHPLVRALPAVTILRLAEVEGLGATVSLLFAEAGRVRCGQRLLASRLFEVLVVQLLRWMLDHPREAGLQSGLLAGLAHPGLAQALSAIHARPGAAWSLQAMAQTAAMSRSTFAATFRAHVGQTPAEYLADWRIALVQSLLEEGMSLKAASAQLGYASAASLSRAFSRTLGVSPRAWLKSARAAQAARDAAARP